MMPVEWLFIRVMEQQFIPVGTIINIHLFSKTTSKNFCGVHMYVATRILVAKRLDASKYFHPGQV